MDPTTTNKLVSELRGQLKLTRNKIALLTSTLGIEPDEMSLRHFIDLLEKLQFRPDALKLFIQEEYKM